MKKKDLIQRSDNTRVDIGTPELTKWEVPFVPDYYEGEREYKNGNYTNPHAKAYAEKISGKVESVSPEFEILSNLGLKGLVKLFTTSIRDALSEIPKLGNKLRSSDRFYYKWSHELPSTKESWIPSYATPNAPTNQAKQYFIKRVKDGGWEKYKGTVKYDNKFIKRQFNPIDYDDAKAIEKLNKELGTEFHVYMKPKAGYASRQIIDHPNTRFTVKNKNVADHRYNKQNRQIAIAHEAGHAVTNNQNIPTISGFDNIAALSHGMQEYFLKGNYSELSQRGSQLKNYFGLTKLNQEFTPAMLQHAYKHYIKDTGVNNNMKEFFYSITDFQKAAKWINNNSLKDGGKLV